MSNDNICLSIFGFQMNSLDGGHNLTGGFSAAVNGLAMGELCPATGISVNTGVKPWNEGMSDINRRFGRTGYAGNEHKQARNSNSGVNITNLNIRENDPCPIGTRHSLGRPRKRSEAEGGAPTV